MLDSEHPDTDQTAQDTTASTPKRRRAASRPAGPPAAVAEAPAQAADAPAEAADAATEAAPEPPKRARRSRANAADPDAAPQLQLDEPAAAADTAPPAEDAPKTPRRRRATRAAEPAEAPAADATGEVAASLAELASAGTGRTRSRGRVKAEAFGMTDEATPDQVLDSLAAAISGRLSDTAAELEEDEDAEALTEGDEASDAEAADEALDADAGDEEAEDDELAEGEAEGEGASPRRRRRRRGGRRRRRGAGDAAVDDETEDADGEPAETTADAEAETGDEPAAEGTARRRRRRRRRGEDSGEVEEDGVEIVVRAPREPRRRGTSANDEVTGIEGSTRMEAKKQRRREGRAAGRRRTPILSESEFLARREAVERTMLIRQADDYSQIAVMEDGILVEHYVDRASATSMIGNIYLGRVQNVLPSMEAAFVDIGRGRNAVLYAGEVDWDGFGVTGQDKKVERVFKSGQQVLVQVSKDPVGAKGARLTSHISIPGRYIVYSPGGHLSGISRKLPEGERRRLKGILDELIEPEASVIVRTAAEGASEEELVRDVNRLKAQWEVLEKKKSGQGPAQLYAEPDLTVRIVRDLFTEDFGALVVDGNGQADDAYDTVLAYVEHVAPHLRERLQRWDRTERGDIFDAHRVHEQVAKALERKVFLPSGGSLIIDRTEAMTVIDVNTGKFTGTSGNLEATVTSNNLEAAEEIVRQLRLRDIGGIIVIDFIDMVLPANRELLLRRLVECLGRDRTRHQVAEVTSLGLVQMTRKKIGTGLAEAFTVACETCKGRGYHVHDAPVASQAPADGGERETGRRGSRGGNATAATTRRGGRTRKEEPVRPSGPPPELLVIAAASEHAHAEAEAAAEADAAAEAAEAVEVVETVEVVAEPVVEVLTEPVVEDVPGIVLQPEDAVAEPVDPEAAPAEV
ncbi:MAG: Rne/Rng family ribonuclease [Actinobacteria bacterium]|nr:Rne/Rng family ribonuclease [Actinomycetota bacterium]